MDRTKMMLGVVIVVGLSAMCVAEGLLERGTLTEGMWGLTDMFAEQGISFGASSTNFYKQNVHGGNSVHDKDGRWSGRIDVTMTIDTEKFLGMPNGTVYVQAKNKWRSENASVDSHAGGTLYGVGDGGGRRAFDVLQVWYEHAFDNGLSIRAGKLDMGGTFECRGCPVSFDGNSYANSSTSQFQSGIFVVNPTIPWADYGIGAIAYYNPTDLWYAGVGFSDAQADSRETGLNTAFHDDDYFTYMAETGVTPQIDSANGPMQGAYRFGMWYKPQPRAHLDGGDNKGDDVGFYISADQLLCKENSDPDDSQGLGAFLRYGYAPSELNSRTNHISLGVRYLGLFDGRDSDVLGIAYGRTYVSDRSSSYQEDYEAILEAYYSIAVAPWLTVSPSIQYVQNPGAVAYDSSASASRMSDSLVLGVRAKIKL